MSIRAKAIAETLEAEIKNGRRLPGSKLPTHRDLAYQHRVALNTASLAMHILAAKGLVVGEVGRGSFVRTPTHIDVASFRIEANDNPKVVNLAHNVMPLPGLAKRYEVAARTVLARDYELLAGYQPHAGRAADRTSGARWLARSGYLPDDPSRVVVCAGAQHAVFIALSMAAKAGDTIAVEALTWPGIKACASMLGIKVVGVPLDAHGLRPQDLTRIATQHRIAALYCMPALHNPTGVVTSNQRREKLAAIARKLDFQIIEDNAYGFLAENMEEEAPPVAVFAPERTWHIRSTSKSLLPGLRACWMLIPFDRERQATDAIRATVWTTPPLGSAVASLWVEDGTALSVEDDKRQEARARNAMARQYLPEMISQSCHSSSMHLWVTLPKGLHAQEIVRQAAMRGVIVTPGSAFGIGSAPNTIRLAIGAPLARSEFERALHVLGKLM